MPLFRPLPLSFPRLGAAALLSLALTTPLHAQRTPPRTADYILAIVNQELVTAGELQQRIERLKAQAQRSGNALPPEAELRSGVLDALIDERVQVTFARDSGQRVDDVELDRAMGNVAAQNQLTVPQLRDRLRSEGIDYLRFRNNIRDQILIERVREREVQARIRISDDEIEAHIQKERGPGGSATQYNIAQILVSVPEDAGSLMVSARRARAENALARVRGGEAFEAVAQALSEDPSRARGGQLGLRPASRLPDAFVAAVKNLKPGELSPQVLQTGAGFHVLKLIEQRDAGLTATQTRARHILLQPTPPLTQEAAARRLLGYKREISAGTKSFEQIARESSQDGSAAQGGDLGWVSPGAFVPEFEEAMNALPINGLSDPVPSRFGVHLIQVTDRREVTIDPKELRTQARAVLREQKFEAAYTEWLRELRSRAYIEMREPPT